MIKQITVKNTGSRMYLHNVDASVTPIEAFRMAGLEYDGTTAIIVAGHPIKSNQAYGPISDIIGTDEYDGVVVIAAIAKHDNALEVRTIGNSVYVVSGYSREDIEEILKWKPDCTHVEECGVEFGVGFDDEGEGKIDEYGVTFAKGDIDGKAFVHMCIPDEMTMEEFKAEFTNLEVAHHLWLLKQIEDGFDTALEDVAYRKKMVLDCFN